MSTPYIGFDNQTLNSLPSIHSGEKIICPHCGKEHEVIDSDPPMLQFYKCGTITYLAGIKNRQVVNTRPDVSGKI